ncbi:MAG TPA: GAF domain-containing protein, partial [Herpetosiphonaceae bacterium]
ILKYGFGTTSFIAIIALLWFVARCTGVQAYRFLVAMSLAWAILYVLHLSFPAGILYAEISGLRRITLPWQEQIVVARGTPQLWKFLIDLWYLVVFAFFFQALARQYQRGQRRPALVLGLALGLFLVARVVDTLLVVGVIDSLYTTQFAFLGIVIAMSLLLSHDIATTESALQIYQQHLHDLVAERTSALKDANRHLAEKIVEQERAEACLQRLVAEVTALKQVAHIGMRLNDLTAALHGMSATATTLFAAHGTYILIPSDQGTDRHLLFGFARVRGPVGPLPLDVALTRLPLVQGVLRDGQSRIVSDVQPHALPLPVQAFVATPHRQSVMLLPLVIRGGVLGCMVVAADQIDRTWTPDDLSVAELIASDVAAAIENTHLYQHAVAARERLTQLHQAAQAMSRASLDPEQVYAELYRAISQLLPSAGFSITLIDATQANAQDVYLVDHTARQSGDHYVLAGSFAAAVLARNQAVRIDDLRVGSPPLPAWQPGGDSDVAQSCVAVLLRGSAEVLGVRCVQRERTYSDEEVDLLELLAAHGAIALEHARRYQQVRELATLAERTRLARDLHDAVTQTLYSASLLAEALPTIWHRDSAAGARDLIMLRHLMRGAMAEMRTLLFELRPTALVAADLGILLRQLGHVLTSQTHIPVELTIVGTGPVAVDVKIAMYRIAQEVFNNIAKHAGATQVAVTLHATPDAVCLSIGDNGRGFDPTAIPDDHMGLQIMTERALSMGAALHVDSVLRQGTTVSVQWPGPTA